MDLAELRELEARLVLELKEAMAALPAHSVRPQQQQRLEDAEDRLREVRAQIKALGQPPKD